PGRARRRAHHGPGMGGSPTGAGRGRRSVDRARCRPRRGAPRRSRRLGRDAAVDDREPPARSGRPRPLGGNPRRGDRDAAGRAGGRPSLGEMPALARAAERELAALVEAPADAMAGPRLDRGRLVKTVEALERSALDGEAAARRLEEVAAAALAFAEAMDFTFLFDETRQLFTIGYRVADGVIDEGRYDLLASEARLTSFLAVARGEVP